MTDLFGNNTEIIRTLGFYQPFGSLMLPPFDKIETRKVMAGKKPPFPLGKYLFYTTKEPTPEFMLWSWCGEKMVSGINQLLAGEPTAELNGYALGIGTLKTVRRMTAADEKKCYVKFAADHEKITWCLIFGNVKRIQPFEFKDDEGNGLGKQGIGILAEKYKSKIIYI